MKERPILFSAPMVLAILQGRKTQTRRVIKRPLKHPWWTGYMAVLGGAIECGPDYPDDDTDFLRCPFGQPGDKLWVRESFRLVNSGPNGVDAIYRCDGSQRNVLMETGLPADTPWKPGIFMPRWASRITLEITQVRVERVQEISAEDAALEGVARDNAVFPPTSGYVSGFARLWDSINAKRGFGWDANPWVWCVTFRKVEEEEVTA